MNIQIIKEKNTDNRMLIGSDFVEGMNTGELNLARIILENQDEIPILNEYPYLLAIEYLMYPPYSQFGKGDLLFYDGGYRLLVVELKSLNNRCGSTARVSRHKARRKVEEQAYRYSQLMQEKYPQFSVRGISFTNEDLRQYL